MGIHGVFKEIGPGQRISLAKLSADHYTTHQRPIRLAVDISIWLFQIQSGKGGSNPALRTFYYRLLRLLTLNIHPLFVFDGPNKPLFKRNKKVGGPGVRVASVPEFLAKQLLKQFGFPWHVAPGEAEAECALLQREGIVDAVMSEDVDTLMFGSGVTCKNWTSENSTKSPTHVNVYREAETKAKSGLDGAGMILVALMSGGDYLPEGIPGCGPKVACDAARAGFGTELCALGKKDTAGLKLWKDRLQHQIRTNEAKYFSRRNNKFIMPEDFPNFEVLGYYTHPCVSSADKLQRLNASLQWDQPIDFAALRTFTSDAFDWRCLTGAQKFIKNLAPAMLVRDLRLRSEANMPEGSLEAQEEQEKAFIRALHGKRNHSTTDGELEYRISFVPASLVPIDLSIEEEDDQFLPAGGDDSEAESEFAALPSFTAGLEASPTKKTRQFKPFDPAQPEKLWVLRTFLQIGCPLLVEEYEASLRDPKEFLKARRKAKAVTAEGNAGNIHAKKGGRKKAAAAAASSDMPENALMAYAKVTKAGSGAATRAPLKETQGSQGNSQSKSVGDEFAEEQLEAVAGFRLPASQVPKNLLDKYVPEPRRTLSADSENVEVPLPRQEAPQRPFARFATKAAAAGKAKDRSTGTIAASKPPKKVAAKSNGNPVPTQSMDAERTPTRRKRRSPDLSSPVASQRTITSYYSPSPRKPRQPPDVEFINLVSSSPAKMPPPRPLTPTPTNLRPQFIRSPEPALGDYRRDALWNDSLSLSPALADFSPGKLPDTVTKRRKKGPLRRYQTAPVLGTDEDLLTPTSRALTPRAVEQEGTGIVEAMDLASPSPMRRLEGGFLVGSGNAEDDEDGHDDDGLVSPSLFIGKPAGGRLSKTNGVHGRDIGKAVSSEKEPSSSYPTPPLAKDNEVVIPPPPVKRSLASAAATAATTRKSKQVAPAPTRRFPRQDQLKTKKAIQLRQSLEGAWKEIDLTDDGSGWKQSNGRAAIGGAGAWRKSGVEVLDLTGA